LSPGASDAEVGVQDRTDGAITVMLADDHAIVRTGLRLLLEGEEGLSVVAEAGDIPTVMRKVRGHRPRVLILDLNLPGTSGLTAIPSILEASPETRIVVLTMQNDPVFAREALNAGALGYVLKEAADTEVVAASRWAPGEPAAPLSARGTEILSLIADGYTTTEIASRLSLSVRTVESHRAHIHRKTGRTTRAELVALARELGVASG